MFSKKMFNTKKTIEVTSEDCTFGCLGTNNIATIKDKLMYTKSNSHLETVEMSKAKIGSYSFSC